MARGKASEIRKVRKLLEHTQVKQLPEWKDAFSAHRQIQKMTDKQFQVLGSPGFSGGDFTFTPRPMEGAKNPPFEGKVCRGFDLTTLTTEDLARQNAIDLSYLITFYEGFDKKESFFLKNLFFDKLAGGPDLRQQIIAGKSETEIRESWQSGLEQFKTIRSKYLLYPDF